MAVRLRSPAPRFDFRIFDQPFRGRRTAPPIDFGGFRALRARPSGGSKSLAIFVFALPKKRIFAIINLRSTIRLLILMAVFGFSLSNRVERTKGGHLSFNKKINLCKISHRKNSFYTPANPLMLRINKFYLLRHRSQNCAPLENKTISTL